MAYARNLARRWTLVREWRTVLSDDPVNYEIADGVMRRVSA